MSDLKSIKAAIKDILKSEFDDATGHDVRRRSFDIGLQCPVSVRIENVTGWLDYHGPVTATYVWFADGERWRLSRTSNKQLRWEQA